MDSSQIEADSRQVLGVGKVHMNSTFNDIYTLDSQYVVWVLSEPRRGRLEKFATWCRQKRQSSVPASPPTSQVERNVRTPPTAAKAVTGLGGRLDFARKSEPMNDSDFMNGVLDSGALLAGLCEQDDDVVASTKPATPPRQPSSEEKLDDLQTRGEGNILGFGKHRNKSWSDIWRNEQRYVSWAIGQVAEGQQGWSGTEDSWRHKLERFATWAKRVGLAEARLPSTPGKPARPICETHGCAMCGPHTANKNALPQNKGRGFYACPTKCAACRQWANGPTAEVCTGGDCCAKKGWLWADGSEADSEVSHRRKERHDATRPQGETGPGPSKRARLDERF